MKLSRELLYRSPEETARRLCLGLVHEASEALARMDDPGDSEALHDFRVALRRLRSLLRAFRPHLAGAGVKKMRARVKTIASSTNAARDIEVQIEWLRDEASRIGEPGASGARHLIALLEARQEETPSPEVLRRGFRPIRRDLQKALSRVRLEGAGDTSVNFVTAAAAIVESHAATLEGTLRDAHGDEDDARLHGARIEAKRLRYLLEPLQGELDGARALVKRMKSLQDLLGELQDTRVMTEAVSGALERAALEEARRLRDIALGARELPDVYAPQNPGLLELLKRQRSRRDRCFSELTSQWAGPKGERFFERARGFVALLRRWPDRDPPRRTFLLRELPEVLAGEAALSVREGWLPGKTIRERVRSTRQGRVRRHSRIVEAEKAPPAEEKLTRPAFEALWPLTAGRRLESEQYELRDGERRWRVTRYPGHDLVLAAVDGTEEVVLPEVLANLVVREVTGVKKYAPLALARQPAVPIAPSPAAEPEADEASEPAQATTSETEPPPAPEARPEARPGARPEAQPDVSEPDPSVIPEPLDRVNGKTRPEPGASERD